MDCDKAIEGADRIESQTVYIKNAVRNGDSTNALKGIRRIRELCDELEKEVTTFNHRPAATEP
jgi:hypothetical protein